MRTNPQRLPSMYSIITRSFIHSFIHSFINWFIQFISHPAYYTSKSFRMLWWAHKSLAAAIYPAYYTSKSFPMFRWCAQVLSDCHLWLAWDVPPRGASWKPSERWAKHPKDPTHWSRNSGRDAMAWQGNKDQGDYYGIYNFPYSIIWFWGW